MINTEKLSQLLTSIAKKELLTLFKRCKVQFKDDNSFITDADINMQQQLQLILKKYWPEYDFLAEEMSADEMATFLEKNSQGFWCLDPIDGTSNFASGLPFFSVSLALIIDSEIYFGIVYDPIRNECFTAIKGQGARLNGKKLKLAKQHLALKKSIALVDFKRLAPELRQRLVLEPPYHSQRSLGSIALDWCWLACDRVQVYVHGKMMLWDYAAGLLIAHEAGCYSLGLDSKPVYQLNLQARPSMAAVDKELFNQWKSYLLKT